MNNYGYYTIESIPHQGIIFVRYIEHGSIGRYSLCNSLLFKALG